MSRAFVPAYHIGEDRSAGIPLVFPEDGDGSVDALVTDVDEAAVLWGWSDAIGTGVVYNDHLDEIDRIVRSFPVDLRHRARKRSVVEPFLRRGESDHRELNGRQTTGPARKEERIRRSRSRYSSSVSIRTA